MIIAVGTFENSSYTFDKVLKKVTILGLGNLKLQDILYINNQSVKGVDSIIYLPEVQGKKVDTTNFIQGLNYPNVTTTELFLEFNTNVVNYSNTDELYIKIDYKPSLNRYIQGGRELKMIEGMPKVVNIPSLFEIGEYEIPNHSPKVVNGYNPFLPSLIEADVSELLTPIIPIIPKLGSILTISSTSALDFDEVLATGTLSLIGVGGSLDTLTVNLIPIISSPIIFNTTIDQTYNDIAENIFNFNSNYKATKQVTIQLTGINGTANITMGTVTKQVTFLTNLILTANQFVKNFRLDYLKENIKVETTGIGDLIFSFTDEYNSLIPKFATGQLVNILGTLNGVQTSLLKISAPTNTGILQNGLIVTSTTTTLIGTTTNMLGGVNGGTGIRKVYICYLLLDGTEVSEVVSLNGILGVFINNSNLNSAVNELSIFTVGVGGTAAGDITVSDVLLNIYRVIKLGEVQDRTCIYRVPKGLAAIVIELNSATLVGKETLFRLKANAIPISTGIIQLPRNSYHTFSTIAAKDSFNKDEFAMPLKFKEGIDIKVTGVDLGGGQGIGISAFKFYTEIIK